MPYHPHILSAIGRTPLVRLNKVVGPEDATVLVKLEYMNPGGAIKDRMALHIIEKAERAGILKPGATIVENTSGNTGVGVALCAAVKGYKCVFTMPDKMSKEKQDTLKAFGAQVIVTPTNVAADSPESYYSVAKRIASETPGSFYLNQYHNPDNIEAHYLSTGPEIWEQTEGRFDAFVAGIGTGGTMSGCGKYFKEQSDRIKNIGVDPIGSVYHSLFKTGKMSVPHTYKVEGIGEDMICGAMDLKVMDDVRQVDDRQCFSMARRLAREEGILAGGSSGGAVHVAAQVAKEMGRGKTIVVILPDGGRSYITKFFSDEWMRDNGFLEPTSPMAATARDVLGARRGHVVTASAADTIGAVVGRLRESNVSQLPLLDAAGLPVGMVHESDLLRALVDGRHRANEAVGSLATPLEGTVGLDTPLVRLKEILETDRVAVIVDQKKAVGIVSKIDVIDFLARRLA